MSCHDSHVCALLCNGKCAPVSKGKRRIQTTNTVKALSGYIFELKSGISRSLQGHFKVIQGHIISVRSSMIMLCLHLGIRSLPATNQGSTLKNKHLGTIYVKVYMEIVEFPSYHINITIVDFSVTTAVGNLVQTHTLTPISRNTSYGR